MPLTEHDRLTQDRLHPRIVELWLALRGLGSVTGFMQTGAHPDDETSAMLAALRFRDGLSTSYACSTRGEGGQNDLGTEAGAELGSLRTAEMERACARLDMRMWWLSNGPKDSITDFGFSKSGVETLVKWGRDRLLAAFVRILRRERPDIICPTFLNVPGQHGHHRAMTEAACLALEAAGDPGFKGCDLPVWQVSKLYLPAWGGGGGSYDDELPPPPASVTVSGKGIDPVTGWSWERIAQHSRMFHASQGMGRWIAPDAERDWPLHLAVSRVGADQTAVTDNLPLDLGDLGLPEAAQALRETVAAFPDPKQVLAAATNTLQLLRSGHDRIAPEDKHRLLRKEAELARVIRLASGMEIRGRLDKDILHPGEWAEVTLEHRPGSVAESSVALTLPESWRQDGDRIGPKPDHPPSDPYPQHWDPLSPASPAIAVRIATHGVEVDFRLAFETPPLVAPAHSVRLQQDKLLLNLARPCAPKLTLEARHPSEAVAALDIPAGWEQRWNGNSATLVPPDGLVPGLTEIPILLDDSPAMTGRVIDYPHIAPRLYAAPAIVRLRAISVELPQTRCGYIGGGNDRVGHWLEAMGAAPELLDERLDDPGIWDEIDSLVIGVFAFRARPGLSALSGRIRSWVEAGGTLVTLYHRPRDNWTPDTTPPRRIEIGQPSLRWRVTDENAAVTHLEPGHPVLTGPNPIGPEDWAGWTKERGLYFAKSWDLVYRPLLEMPDPDEAPHRGALLAGDIGQGRHCHVALGLHVQMENLTPGAFRLMANLIARRESWQTAG